MLASSCPAIRLDAEGIPNITSSFLEGIDIDRDFNVFAEIIVFLRRVFVHIIAASGSVLNCVRYDLGGSVAPSIDRPPSAVNNRTE